MLDHAAGVRLLNLLRTLNYRFTTPTPGTHRRVLQHPGKDRASTVRDALGWSLPFAAEAVPAAVFDALEATGVLVPHPLGYRAVIRVSSLGEDLFLHSAFPTDADDAVFFGPDTYRFARFVRATLSATSGVRRLVDIGAGSGAGAVVAARASGAADLTLTDVNPSALRLARINLEAAGLKAKVRRGAGLEPIAGPADVIIANPPFIAGDGDRTYRDGGDLLGARLSLEWAVEGARRLSVGGMFILYTGSAIVEGQDALRAALAERLRPVGYCLSYEEIDPDIFGGQLASKAYEGVERIAAVGAVIRRLR